MNSPSMPEAGVAKPLVQPLAHGPQQTAQQTKNASMAHSEQQYSSANVHPVFFTPSLHKPTFPLPKTMLSPMFYNPVAYGYVLEPSSSRKGSLMNKL